MKPTPHLTLPAEGLGSEASPRLGSAKRTAALIAAVGCLVRCSNSNETSGGASGTDAASAAGRSDASFAGAPARSDSGTAGTSSGEGSTAGSSSAGGSSTAGSSAGGSSTAGGSAGAGGVGAGGAGGTGSAGDTTGGSTPSCAAGGLGMTNCGPGGKGSESCCTSLKVSGGTFYRSYDGVSYTDKSHPASVSDFRLDKYEITVGRFRQFVAAIVGGWRPAAGSGKHTHLNGGKGLSATGGGYEAGWDASWNSLFPTTTGDWTSKLVVARGTWTSSPAANESQPISNQAWYDAYAFCIWDGGFLPSEAEWNYAAAGGGGASGQRVYPWSSPSTSTTIDCAHANYAREQPGNATTACTSPSCVGGCPTKAPNNV